MTLCFKIGKGHSVKTLLWCGRSNSVAKEYWGQGTPLALAISLRIVDENLCHLNYLKDRMVILETTIMEMSYTRGTMGTIWLFPL